MHRRLAAELTSADAAFTVVPNAGHASYIDNPAFFSRAVREFLSRSTSSRG
ncbi:alpha/beta fold hydrolase [Halomontanus rarus]|uniref:alpha/beta fold hydrolase n=1 Tax=Halomontanus rarus TaxID=3034020 RepID=UPI0023E7D15F|nr:hypothetical protein [Halovivax sp. TS33]